MKWHKICKKNLERDYWLALQKELALKAPLKVLAGLSPLCSVFLSAFCHSLPFSFPDFVFLLKIGFIALITYLPADLCHEFLHSPTSQPLTYTVKSIWQGMSNTAI